MAEVEFTIERDGYESITLDSDTIAPYGFSSRTTGLGVGPVALRLTEGAADGAEDDGERTGAKPGDLGVIIRGSNRMETTERIRALRRLVRGRKDTPRPKLVASYATGEVLELPFIYESGLELEHVDALPKVYRCTLGVVFPLPFWEDRLPRQVSVQVEGAPRPFLPKLSHLQVGSSSAIGDVFVENVGDVEAPTITRLVGPCTSASFYIGDEGYAWEEPLLEGEVITIDHRTKEVVDEDGLNRYDGLSDAPLFPYLPDGSTRVRLEMAGASAGRLEQTTTIEAQNRVTNPALRTGRAGWTSSVDGTATESNATTGFAGSSDGYLQRTWTAISTPGAQISCSFEAYGGETLSAGMALLSTRAQKVNPVFTCYNNDGLVLRNVYGESVELPANTVVTIGLPGELSGTLPPGTAVATITASIDETTEISWQVGDTLRASRALIVTGDNVPEYFDGSFPHCAWLGTANAAQSVKYALARVGFSEISMLYKPRREVVY